jgi:hypothetical protein
VPILHDTAVPSGWKEARRLPRSPACQIRPVVDDAARAAWPGAACYAFPTPGGGGGAHAGQIEPGGEPTLYDRSGRLGAPSPTTTDGDGTVNPVMHRIR